MNRKFIIGFVLAVVLGTSCHKNNPADDGSPPCIDPGIVPASPYDSPIWHPSGEFIGFNHTPLRDITYPSPCNPRQEFDYDSTGFWLIKPDGTEKRRIFTRTLLAPAWSPDGEWIAYCEPAGGGVQIFKMRFTGNGFDTSTRVQLTTYGRNFYPAWSPDGKWIAFDRSICEGPRTCGVWVVTAEGQDARWLFGASFPAWFPDGGSLIGVIGASSATAGTKFVLYSIGESRFVDTLDGVGTDNRLPAYSTSGSSVAFWANGNLWVMDKYGNQRYQLTISGVDVDFGLPFSWSPAGDKIVYTRYQPDDWTMENGVLYVIDLGSGNETRLTSNP